MRWIFDLHQNVDRDSDIIGLTYKVMFGGRYLVLFLRNVEINPENILG